MVSINSFDTKLNVSKTKYLDIKICTLTPTVVLERFGSDCVKKYFKFVGLELGEFLNWDFQI